MDDSAIYYDDDWPILPDGSDYDGHNLLQLLKENRSPFADRWDVNLLIQEIENKLQTQVIDIPSISKGSNNYGFHLKLSNQSDVLARLARGDLNMPNYGSFPIEWQVPELKFEAAVYELLLPESAILTSRLLYYRVPVEHPFPHTEIPRDIDGRRLLVFERANGESLHWRTATAEQKTYVLTQSATIRAALFNFALPHAFAAEWFLDRLFEHKPKSLPAPVAPTRSFCIALFTSKIHATIKDVGDMIGWESDQHTVGPIALAAKQSLLRLIPHIMPQEIAERPTLYRLVLDHGDFGIHNMSITDEHNITSVFDWETGCIVPAILSDPLMAVEVDLVTDKDAVPSMKRVSKDATLDERADYMNWANQYFEILYQKAPDYKVAIQAGRDARHLWFSLRDWRGDDPEGYFGSLGVWAEARLKELVVNEREILE